MWRRPKAPSLSPSTVLTHQGRHWPGLDLHDANRRGRRCAADLGIQAALEGADKAGVPAIADGGVRYSGDIAKALGRGRAQRDAGESFAGTDESPGEIELYQGRSTKAIAEWAASPQCSRAARTVTSRSSRKRIDCGRRKARAGSIEGRVPYKVPVQRHSPADGRRARRDGLLRMRDDR